MSPKATIKTPKAATASSPESGTRQVMLGVNLLDPNGWNKKRPVDAEFQASVTSIGVIQSLLVRPHPRKQGRFEIVCGERRWEAAKKAARGMVPAIVAELSDPAAKTLTFVENNQRAGMTIWQEAELLADASKDKTFTVTAAAAALGWSEVHVRRRMKLLELTAKWRKRITTASHETWTAEMAELVASYPAGVQDVLESSVRHVSGMADLRRQLGGLTHVLAAAPFDIKDANLNAKAGACISCPLRSSACTDLFGDTKETTGPGDKCLNPACWEKKVEAHIAAKAAALKKEHGNVVKISAERWYSDDGVLGTNSYTRVAKNAPGAMAAVVVDGKGAGSSTWVKKSTPASRAAAEVKTKTPAAAMKEKRGALEARRWVLVGLKVQEALDSDNREKLYLPPISVLAAATVAFGCTAHDEVMGSGWEHLRKLLQDEKLTHQQLLDVVCERLDRDIQAERNSRHGADFEDLQEAVTGACRLFKLDVEALKADADTEIPEPKSWASQPAAAPSKAKKAATKSRPKAKASAGEAGDDGEADDE